ncbi:hypothetical protein [Rhodococcoides fascians]|uniref:hypothetical protein n=1 Tax=Rhodococcoides fascians TaxID=1828 RepID=UPI00050CF508|nr:hypothetical protein [Rhodococcus fascians]
MSGRKLRTFVCVDGPHGPAQFGPDSDLPDWAAKLITNPAAWDGEPEPEAKAEVKYEPKKPEVKYEPKKRVSASRTTKAASDDSGDEG